MLRSAGLLVICRSPSLSCRTRIHCCSFWPVTSLRPRNKTRSWANRTTLPKLQELALAAIRKSHGIAHGPRKIASIATPSCSVTARGTRGCCSLWVSELRHSFLRVDWLLFEVEDQRGASNDEVVDTVVRFLFQEDRRMRFWLKRINVTTKKLLT